MSSVCTLCVRYFPPSHSNVLTEMHYRAWKIQAILYNRLNCKSSNVKCFFFPIERKKKWSTRLFSTNETNTRIKFLFIYHNIVEPENQIILKQVNSRLTEETLPLVNLETFDFRCRGEFSRASKKVDIYQEGLHGIPRELGAEYITAVLVTFLFDLRSFAL